MPLYDIACGICGKEEEVFRTIKEYDDLPICCGHKMKRMLCAPAVHGDEIKPYKSTVTGEMIYSRSDHKRHLRNHNLVELGNDMPKPKKMGDVAGRKEAIIDTCRKLKVKGFN
jgi:putative FmdB family regulatory protein